jgi:integrase
MLNARQCSCGPRVVGRLYGRDHGLGHLQLAWKVKDVGEFEDKLADLRDPNRRKRADRSPLLRDWYAEWIIDMEAAVKQEKLAPRTVAAYRQRWRLHIEKDPIAALPINAIGARDLRRFVARKMAGEKGLSHRYANELLTPISAMLTDAEVEGYIESNPCRSPRRARHGATQRNAVYEQLDRNPPQHLEIADARALVLATAESHRLMVLWPLVTGARRAEILAATFDDIIWPRREVNIHHQLDDHRQRAKVKAGRKREVVLWSGLERLLAAERRAGAERFIFRTRGGTPLSLGSGDKPLGGAYEAIGAREQGRMWHALRHTYATYLRSSGVRWEAVEYMMGHRPRDTTGRYVHLLASDNAAVEAALTAAFGDIVDLMLESKSRISTASP